MECVMNLYLVVRHYDQTVPRQWEEFGPYDTIEQVDAVARRWRNSIVDECYLQYGAQGPRVFYSHKEAADRKGKS